MRPILFGWCCAWAATGVRYSILRGPILNLGGSDTKFGGVRCSIVGPGYCTRYFNASLACSILYTLLASPVLRFSNALSCVNLSNPTIIVMELSVEPKHMILLDLSIVVIWPIRFLDSTGDAWLFPRSSPNNSRVAQDIATDAWDSQKPSTP